MTYKWDNYYGIIDAETDRQIVQLVQVYATKNERIRLGKLIVELLNNYTRSVTNENT